MNKKQIKIIDALSRYVDEKKQCYFVVDVKHVDDKIVVTYLDGHVTEEEYIEHNYKNYYRYRMTNQIKDTILPNLNAQMDAINTTMKNANFWMGTSLMGMFLAYGLDANEFFKIFFGASIIYSLITRLVRDRKIIEQTRNDAITLLPLIAYGMNDSAFDYIDPETKTRENLVNVEDVYNGTLSVESLVGIAVFANFVEDEFKKGLKNANIKVLVDEDGLETIQMVGEDFDMSLLDDENVKLEDVPIKRSK